MDDRNRHLDAEVFPRKLHYKVLTNQTQTSVLNLMLQSEQFWVFVNALLIKIACSYKMF